LAACMLETHRKCEELGSEGLERAGEIVQ